MAERTLAEAVGELRLSDKRFGQDMGVLRKRLLGFVTQLEADAKVSLNVEVDEDALIEQFIKLEAASESFAPKVKIALDAENVLNDLVALSSVAQDISVGVKLDQDSMIDAVIEIEAAGQSLAPTIPLEIDIDNAVADLIGVADLAAQVGDATSGIGAAAQQGSSSLVSSFGAAGERSGAVFGSRLAAGVNSAVGVIGAAAGGFLAGALIKGFARLTTIRDATASLTVALGDAT
jgi:hypothetical protein